jgi:hypothetical protein
MNSPRDLLPGFTAHLPVRGAAVAVVAVMLGVAAIGQVASATDASDAQSCFMQGAWDGQWKVSPDTRSIYVKQNGVVYRFDLEQQVPMLLSSFTVLYTAGTSDAVCRPEDLHLIASDQLGGVRKPIVRKITRLTPEEVSELPKKLQP